MLSRKKFKASVVVRDALAENPNGNRKSLVSAARRATQQADDARRESELNRLEKQGQMMRTATPDGARSKAVQSLPAEQVRFALNAAVDTLPLNANLHLWKKKDEMVPPVHCVEKGRVYCMFSTTAVWQETSDATTTAMMQCCE